MRKGERGQRKFKRKPVNLAFIIVAVLVLFIGQILRGIL